ncbi:MAG TPA: hypothetical protein VFK16_08385 [Gemmatimonadaceae bacterium]|nr:hypothetical protein [Gemmatimonadaceae bacterium]
MSKAVTETPSDGLLLPGLDGANPLGFLAAVGLFRTVALMEGPDSARLQWEPGWGTWIPRLGCAATSASAVLELMDQHLIKDFQDHPLSSVYAIHQMDSPAHRRDSIKQYAAAVTCQDRTIADWLAAVTSDAVPPEANNQLQTVRRDYFQRTLTTVMANTTREHLERAIFQRWLYADALENQSLHIDPSEDRRHAYQWHKPSGDPDRKRSGGMLGANRLAIEALPLFVSLPEGMRLHTLGFAGFRSKDTRWTWPIWDRPLTFSVTSSLLTLPELQEVEFSRAAVRGLRERGVGAVFRSRRILVAKTPNFAVAECIA